MNNNNAERQLEREINMRSSQLFDLGITSEAEQEQVLWREFGDRYAAIKTPQFEEEAIDEIKENLEKHLDERNEASMKEKGHPEFVFKMVDGVRNFKKYDSLTPEEIKEFLDDNNS
jgi:hypothetical protein